MILQWQVRVFGKRGGAIIGSTSDLHVTTDLTETEQSIRDQAVDF